MTFTHIFETVVDSVKNDFWELKPSSFGPLLPLNDMLSKDRILKTSRLFTHSAKAQSLLDRFVLHTMQRYNLVTMRPLAIVLCKFEILAIRDKSIYQILSSAKFILFPEINRKLNHI